MCTFPREDVRVPILYMVPCTHANPYSKWHRNRFSRFSRVHSRVQQTDRPIALHLQQLAIGRFQHQCLVLRCGLNIFCIYIPRTRWKCSGGAVQVQHLFAAERAVQYARPVAGVRPVSATSQLQHQRGHGTRTRLHRRARARTQVRAPQPSFTYYSHALSHPPLANIRILQ